MHILISRLKASQGSSITGKTFAFCKFSFKCAVQRSLHVPALELKGINARERGCRADNENLIKSQQPIIQLTSWVCLLDNLFIISRSLFLGYGTRLLWRNKSLLLQRNLIKRSRPAQGIKAFVGQTSLREVNCGLSLFFLPFFAWPPVLRRRASKFLIQLLHNFPFSVRESECVWGSLIAFSDSQLIKLVFLFISRERNLIMRNRSAACARIKLLCI